MTPHFTRNRARLYVGDVLDVLRGMDSESVHCCVTSPPYWGLRDYGMDGQIGLEPTPEAYTAKMVEVFREVRRVLRNDATAWVNLGDSYNAYNDNRGPSTSFQSATEQALPDLPSGNGLTCKSLKPKDLVGIPWRVAFALQADGWYLRSDIIWHKPNPMPESVTDRPTKSHEYIFLLSKSGRYYDAEAIKEPAQEWTGQAATFQRESGKATELVAPGQQHASHRPNRPSVERGAFNGKTEALPGRNAFRAVVPNRNKRTVWTIPTQP
jgi:DNA modification methylase